MTERRLFFALWPDSSLRRGIVARRRRFDVPDGRPVPFRNLHLTLVFPGSRPAGTLPAIIAAAGRVGGTGFELNLDRYGWFSGPRVLWLGGDPSPAGRALVAGLASEMEALGIELDDRPWQPHVTLFRGGSCPDQLPEPTPLTWQATRFSLVESRPNRRYQVLRTWSLE